MINTIEQAIEDIKAGKMVIVVDDEDRENEGDLVMAGDLITADDVNFMIKEARGLVCTPITQAIADRLELKPMIERTCDRSCNFTVSIDAKEDSDTGISPMDRMITVRKMADPNSTINDFILPGHTFPLIAKDGGVLERMGHTEASIDLACLAGLSPVAVICEIINDDGSMARLPDLKEFAAKWDLKIVTIDDLIEYRKSNESSASAGRFQSNSQETEEVSTKKTEAIFN